MRKLKNPFILYLTLGLYYLFYFLHPDTRAPTGLRLGWGLADKKLGIAELRENVGLDGGVGDGPPVEILDQTSVLQSTPPCLARLFQG